MTFSTGDFPSNPLEKAGYWLEFHDEFDETQLDTRKWLPFYLPHWSSRAQTAPHYTIKDGCLVLQIVQNQPPWCPEFDGEVRCSALQTGLFAGPAGSKAGQLRFSDKLVVREAQEPVQLYTPQYGYFEFRAKGLNTSANHFSVFMIGYEDSPERSAEITNFEILGAHTHADQTQVGYGVHPWADPKIKDEFYRPSLPINAAKFHVYGLEWTPTHIDFYIDNQKIGTVNQSPNYPMQFMLTVYEHPFEGAWTGVYDPTAPYPKTFTIDYFRAYQPEGGYPSG